MRKKLLYAFLIIVTIIFLFFLIIKSVFYDDESLKGEHIIDNHISIIGDYIFYEDGLTKAKNLKTGEVKIAGIGIYNVDVYDDELYYFAQRSVNPESYFCKRGINSFMEINVIPHRVISYQFYENYLYFQKQSYSTDIDGNENGYIYRMNLDTNQVEEVISCRTRGFKITNDMLYYTILSEEGYEQYGELLSEGIYSYSLIDETEAIVVKGWVGDFYLDANNIVYSRYNSSNNESDKIGEYSLLWLNIDTNKTTKVSDNVEAFRVYSSNICYKEKHRPDEINIFNCNKNAEDTIHADGIDCTYGFVLYDNKLYYYDKYHNFSDVEI